MHRTLVPLICLALTLPVAAQGVAVGAGDTLTTVATAQQGKRITLRLRSGQEMSGVVRQATDRLLVLGEVSGREFFDAVVPLDAVEAILVRVRTP